MIYIMKIHANLHKCVISFKNQKFMQKRVNILDSKSFKFVFGDEPIKVTHCPQKTNSEFWDASQLIKSIIMNHKKYIRFYKKFRPKMMINKVRNENFTQPMRQHTRNTHARMYTQDIPQ